MRPGLHAPCRLWSRPTGVRWNARLALYISPEALTDPDSVDARSDLYALGAVGYWLLAGDDVFRGESLIEVCSKHLLEVPEPPSARGERGGGAVDYPASGSLVA